MHRFSEWLNGSAASVLVRDVTWAVPILQCIHIVAIAMLVGSVLVSDLRLAGVMATEESAAAIVRRYAPWTWGALAILLLTGLAMIVAEPGRVLGKAIFWNKMALVAGAFALTVAFRGPLLGPAGRPWLVKPLAWLSLGIWTAVILCGRWIAYTVA